MYIETVENEFKLSLSDLNIIQIKSRANPQLLEVTLLGFPPPLPISGHTRPYGAKVSSQIIVSFCLWAAFSSFPLSWCPLYCSNGPLVVSEMRDVANPSLSFFFSILRCARVSAAVMLCGHASLPCHH